MTNVEYELKRELKEKKTLVFVLIDSEASDTNSALMLAKDVENVGASAILIGGSSATDQLETTNLIKELKKIITIPVILFPGNVTGVVHNADAILFTTLLNSENSYFITKAQAISAPLVLKFGLEALPTGYIVIGTGTSVEFIGSARGIPFEKFKLAVAYSLAARFFGMRFVYLDAGSGSHLNIEPKMVNEVRKIFHGFLIVGGGIKDPKTAKNLSNAGADILVISTLLEDNNNIDRLSEIIKLLQTKTH